MTRVEVRSYVRLSEGSFLAVDEVSRFTGDSMYVPGAISLVVDGIELFGLELWDDVNWLWPLLIQALNECRQTGSGNRYFPDQPISITAERAWPGHTLLRVTNGRSVNRSVVAPDKELFEAVALAGLNFFLELRRLCPNDDMGEEEAAIIRTWLSERARKR